MPIANAVAPQQKEQPPFAHAPLPGPHAEQQHQRIQRQQIASQQRSAQNGEKQRVPDQDDPDSQQRRAIHCWSHCAIRKRPWREDPCGCRTKHRHKQVHVGREMKDPVTERDQNAQWIKCRCRVVAQILRIAEDKSSLVTVVGIPPLPMEESGSTGSRLREPDHAVSESTIRPVQAPPA